MYLVREVFRAKPGKAKELVKKFKEAVPYFKETEGGVNMKVMTDIVATYWTVVLESEVEDIGKFITQLRSATGSPELTTIMKGYMDLVDEGHREIYLIE
jgi:hypothetical protein